MHLPDQTRLEEEGLGAGSNFEPASSSVWRLAIRAISASRTIHAIIPASEQILGRPGDPLAVSTSYVIIRNGIGALGLLLPIAMIVGGGIHHVQGSLSAYYHFSASSPAQYGAGTMRDVFVGMLCAIGAFLFFYRGHSLQEDVALNIAGISAVLVAFFPMDWPPDASAPRSTSSTLHSVCATLFFVMIAYVCIFRSRDTLCIMFDEKRRRIFERVYVIFGILMLATPATVYFLEVVQPRSSTSRATLFVEVGGVFIFAAFWLVKGWEIRSSVRSYLRPKR